MENVGPASIERVTALESAYVSGGSGSLGLAWSALAGRWRSGARDRETALRLAFLDWYSCSEPDFLTGLPGLHWVGATEESLFQEALAHLLGADQPDVEVLFVLGWMMKSFPWCCGAPSSAVEQQGHRLWAAYESSPERLTPETFVGRGAYGHYFSHILATHRRR